MKRKEQIKELEARIETLEKVVREFFGSRGEYFGNGHVQGKYDELLDHLGIEYRAETKKGFRKIKKETKS